VLPTLNYYYYYTKRTASGALNLNEGHFTLAAA